MPRFELTDYQNIEMDFEYQDLLRKIKHDGEWHVEAMKLMEGSKLKTELMHMNLKTVSFFNVEQSKHVNWFSMAGSAVEQEYFSTPSEQHELFLAVSKIKDIVSKYK